MSRLKDVMIDVQADIETVMVAKPHLTEDAMIATVCASRKLRDAQPVSYDFVKEIYDSAFGDKYES
tara:strand:- start:926 stop:1123 length:198 start_codon:yes stop_codon:yes gene_type:complete